jgi:hypothetical protein
MEEKGFFREVLTKRDLHGERYYCSDLLWFRGVKLVATLKQHLERAQDVRDETMQ